MNDADRPRRFRLSLRQILTLFAAMAAACAALKYANEWWRAFAAFTVLLAFVAAVIAAIVDRGPRQAFAIGAAVAIGVYMLLLYSMNQQIDNAANWRVSNPEFEPYDGILPTTRLLRTLHSGIVEVWNVNPQTGELIKKLPPQTYGGQGFRNTSSVFEVPRRNEFAAVGHCLWALAFGYAGGTFGRYAHGRRLVADAVIRR
jgi:hypothetical protein